MIQRIQTVYLALAFILTLVCLCMQIGTFEPEEMVGNTYMYNLWNKLPDGSMSFRPWPLFVLLLLSCPLAILAIFSYKNRPAQIRYCNFCMLLIIAWVVAFVLYGYVFVDKGVSFTPSFVAGFPIVALIFYYLARRGVIHDEKLVRAADRIR